MKINEYDEVIIRYLEGDLSKSDENAFEAELRTNEELRTAFNFHLRLDKVISSRESDRKYEEYLESFRKKYRPAKKITFRKRYLIAAAALIIIMLTLAFLLFSMNADHLSGEELYASHYSAYNLEDNYRSAVDLPIEKGLALYNKGNYSEALSYFESKLAAQQATAKAGFIAGISALELNMPEKAIDHFKQVLQTENLEFYQHAQWYLSLAYLKSNKIAEAEVLLQALSNIPGFYQDKAKNLLEELN